MAKVFMLVFLIFGTVVGSGFSSGKEIMVFFSQFGTFSYLYIALAAVMFFFLFYFFLSCGKKALKCLDKFGFLRVFVLLNSIVFCASMFAGIRSLFSYFPVWLAWLLIAAVLVLCFFVTLHGLGGLEKANLYIMPIAAALFLIVLGFCMTQSSQITYSTASWAGAFYSPLYVALNTCMSGIVICRAGENLSKKQTFFASLLSALLLFIFLILGNFALQRNLQMQSSEMPFLAISSQNPAVFALAFVVVLAGCFSTLISLCYTLKTSFDRRIKSKNLSALLAILLPFALSGIGFSGIVSFLYPVCSVLGIFLLLFMIFSK